MFISYDSWFVPVLHLVGVILQTLSLTILNVHNFNTRTPIKPWQKSIHLQYDQGKNIFANQITANLFPPASKFYSGMQKA